MIRKKGGRKFPLLGCLPACGIPSSLSEESSLQNFSSKGSLSGVTGASDGWCPQPGREGWSSFACQREVRMADFQNRNSYGGWSSKSVIYTVGEIRPFFWNEGKSYFLKIFNHWVINISEDQKMLPESILTFLVLCSVLKEKQDPAVVQPDLQAQMQSCPSVGGLVAVLVPRHIWCTAASLPALGDSGIPSWFPLMTFQPSEPTPVPVVLERAALQWQHWNPSEPSRKIPLWAHSNRVQNRTALGKWKTINHF